MLGDEIMSDNQQSQDRIDILESILLRLHHGTSPEDVQDEFNKHFTGVSAIEISMMEHQLMHGDSEITFEDVLKLCNVHANLFKNAVREGDTPDADQAGHPVQVFKDENHAFRAALMRINNLLNVLGDLPSNELEDGMLRGLRRQFDLLGQFDIHYERKEKLFFPMMEQYGHDAPPKVMWAKDDEIRDQFKAAYRKMEQFPKINMSEVKELFSEFEYEFNEMIFKEEAILINILLESLTIEDWYQIAQESEAYGYAIIRPSEIWVPEHLQVAEPNKNSPEFTNASTENSLKTPSETKETITRPLDELISNSTRLETKKIILPGGNLTVTFEANSESVVTDPNLLDAQTEIEIGDGFLSRQQINLILDYMPIEITLINTQDIVIFSNYNEAWSDRQFYYRDFNTLGRSAETLYQRPLKSQVMQWIAQFKNGQLTNNRLTTTIQSQEGIVKLDFIPIYDDRGQYEGYIELAMRVDYFDRVNKRMKRELTPVEDYQNAAVFKADLQSFDRELNKVNTNIKSTVSHLESYKLGFTEGDLTLTWEQILTSGLSDSPSPNLDNKQPLRLRNGALSLEHLTNLMNVLPFEVTFVDHQDIFQYFNNIVPYKEMIFVRTPAQIKRDLELCHPPYLWPIISELIDTFKNQERHFDELWYPTANNEYIYILYQAMYDLNGNFKGILETVLDIQPLLDINK